MQQRNFGDVPWQDWVEFWEGRDDAPGDAAGFVAELTAIADAAQRGDRTRRVACGIDLLLGLPQLGGSENQYGSVQPGPIPADLSNTGLGDAVLVALAASPHLARLVEWNLSFNTFGDGGAAALARSAHADGLQRLNVSGNRLSEAASAHLRERIPEVIFD